MVLVTAEKEGSAYSIELDPIGFRMPVENTKSCYLRTGRLCNQPEAFGCKGSCRSSWREVSAAQPAYPSPIPGQGC